MCPPNLTQATIRRPPRTGRLPAAGASDILCACCAVRAASGSWGWTMNKLLLLSTALAALLPATAALAGGGPPPAPSPTDGHFTFLLGLAVEFGDTSTTPDVGITGKALVAPL